MTNRWKNSASMATIIVASGLLTAAVAPAAKAGGLEGTFKPRHVVRTWTGPYAGAHIGGGWSDWVGEWETCCSSPEDSLFLNALDIVGPAVGGHLGYNHQIGSLVLGLEADITGTWLFDGGTVNTNTDNFEAHVHSLSSIRGRLGMSVDDHVLLYVTGGLSYIDAEFGAQTSNEEGRLVYASLNNVGGVVGAGAEVRPRNGRFSFRAEGLYHMFDNDPTSFHALGGTGSTGNSGVVDDAFVLRLGVSVHLNGL